MARPTNKEKFIKHVQRMCRLFKVRPSFYPHKSLLEIDGGRFEGYFCADDKELHWAGNDITVLAHEYGHMLQCYLTPLKWEWYTKFDKYVQDANGDALVGNGYIGNAKWKEGLRRTLQCEYDNELQTVAILQSFEVEGINYEDDCERVVLYLANIYLLQDGFGYRKKSPIDYGYGQEAYIAYI